MPVPDRSVPDEPRQQLAVLTVEHMDGLRVDRLSLRLLDGTISAHPHRPRPRAAGGGAMSDYLGLIVGVLLLAFNAFFVGAEFALISARRSQIEPRALGRARGWPAPPCTPWRTSP